MSEPEFDRKKQTIEQGDWCAHCTCDPDVGFMPCELCHDQAVIWDMRKEVERLRDLVRRAYVEGFSDGGMAAHPLGPQSSDVWDWETSEAKQELGDDKNATI